MKVSLKVPEIPPPAKPLSGVNVHVPILAQAEYLVGIDAGGTRSTVVIARPDGQELLRREGAAARFDLREPHASALAIEELTRGAIEAAGLRLPISALCAGVAGAGGQVEREMLRATLEAAELAQRVSVVSDGEAALEGALSGAPGIALVAGTGSVAFARAEDGRTERCGGWGTVVGDEGSGYAIARAGLRAALHAADGRGATTILLPAIFERLAVTTPGELARRSNQFPKREIAALAPEVTAAAEAGDGVAGAILDHAATDLALHARALYERLSPWQTPPAIALHGGLFRSATFTDRVERAVAEQLPTFRRARPAGDAATGAVRLAVMLFCGRG